MVKSKIKPLIYLIINHLKQCVFIKQIQSIATNTLLYISYIKYTTVEFRWVKSELTEEIFFEKFLRSLMK